MADEFQLGSGNWWESSTPRNRYETTVGSTTASTSSLASSFGWPTEIADMKARSSMESGSVSGGDGGGAAAGGLLPDPTFQMMDLTLSSQTLDWNQALFRAGEKGGESSFRSMLQEEASSGTFQHHHQQQHNQQEHDQWNRHNKIYSGNCDQDSTRSLSLEQSHDFSPNMSTGSNHPNFQLDSSATYGNSTNSPPPNHVLQGLLVSDHHNQAPMNYAYTNYGGGGGGGSMNAAADHQFMAAGPPSWGNNSNKFPQFLRNSPPPKQPPPAHGGQLHFSNNTPFWNASSASMNDIRPSLFPSLQSPITLPNFEEKTKNSTEARDLGMAKKSGNETGAKRARSDTPSTPMPAFKVRKEKMGDRITALQQLVSPFGKTDTASVLSEAIEYIKFLHEQVSALSTPYMKSGAPMTVITHQQNIEISKEGGEGPKQDLRSRGLCLVPVSSTFPVTHETTVDFWTPRLGGTFR